MFRTAALVTMMTLPGLAEAQTPIVLTFDGEVPSGSESHFFLPFDVPTGVVEIEVRHDDQSANNILDWGLDDAAGTRGWGGGNTEPAVVGTDRASRSYVPGPIRAETWRVVVGKAKLVDLPATYHVEVELRFASTLAPQPERTPYVDPGALRSGAAWYAGDFHVHSRESGDASATLDAIGTLARSRGLDFVTISDHNTHTGQDFFADAQARHPELLFLPSVEFTTYSGHANAFGATTWVNHRIGVEGATMPAAAQAFADQGAILSLNHPAFMLGDQCIGCAWEHALPPEWVGAMEIMTTGLPIVQAVFFDQTIARWDALCDQGAHVAALGGSDDHRAGAGSGSLDAPIGNPTTMVHADALSLEALLVGVRTSRTVVKVGGPDGPMIHFDAIDRRDGDTVRARRTTLTVDVRGGAERSLLWFKNGVAIGDAVFVPNDDFRTELEVVAPTAGEDRYRVELYGFSGRETVTSHVWITRTGAPAPADGCSCRAAGGERPGPTLGIASGLGLLALAVRRRLRRRAPRG